jgi:hypothetical protein
MTPSDEILKSIETRLSELHREIAALQAARTALDGRRPAGRATASRAARDGERPAASAPRPAEAATAPRAGGAAAPIAPIASAEPPPEPPAPPEPRPADAPTARAPRRTPARRRAARASGAQVVPAGKLELLLSEGDGLTTAALAQRANGSRDQVLTLLREMEEAGRVRRIGSSRATRWRAITDEERIAARAAQLAAQSRAARAKAGAD